MKFLLMGRDWGRFLSALVESLEADGFAINIRFFIDSDFSLTSLVQLTLRRLRSLEKSRLTSWLVSLARVGFDWANFFYGLSGVRRGGIVVISGLISRGQSMVLFPICKVCSVRTVLVLHGTDARPLYLNGKSLESYRRLGAKRFARRVRKQSKAVSAACERASFVIAWQGVSHFTTVPVYRFERVSFPLTREGRAGGKHTKRPANPLKVLHAPSDAVAKGTNLVQEVVANLQAEGLPIGMRTLTGVSNTEVLRELENCDLLIDQVFSDNALGLSAREAGARRKPVLVAGDSLDRIVTDAGHKPPIIICKPEDLAQTLRLVLEDRDRLEKFGDELYTYLNGQSFIEWFMEFLVFAQKENQALTAASTVYRDFHPGFGGYAPKKELAVMVRGLYDFGGVEALCLGDQAGFVEEMLKFYGVLKE